MSVVIETTIGDITVDLYLKERPNACLNFLKLCRIKYYNLCVFYKVERNFVAQTGDPTSTGRGGQSIFSVLYGDQAAYFDAEIKPRLKHEKLGTLSMVNNGNNMHGSQFFLTLGENLTYLDESHTVFGEVTEGFDILLKINEAICDPNNRPYQDIRITHTVILHDPFDDPPGLEIPDSSPIPTKEMLESDYIGADEEIDDTKGKDAEEIEERIKESEAKARATILEMVGDIPDADVKPPENVLFVCKLNPVTTAEDLEIIFSRFGSIVSCEIIKDHKTGESLQYAFIEFEKEEDCENAYFKMDNVLIDDRRIHVDFSQSVSKMQWDKRGGTRDMMSRKTREFTIKRNEKESDGYEMVFDMSDNSDFVKAKNKKRARDSNYGDNESVSRHYHDKEKKNYDNKKYKSYSKDDARYSNEQYRSARNLESHEARKNLSYLKESKSSKYSQKKSRHESKSTESSNYERTKSSKKSSRHRSQSSSPERLHYRSPQHKRKEFNMPQKSKNYSTSPESHNSHKIKSKPVSYSRSRSHSSDSSSVKSPKFRLQAKKHRNFASKSPEPSNYKKVKYSKLTTYRSTSASPDNTKRKKDTGSLPEKHHKKSHDSVKHKGMKKKKSRSRSSSRSISPTVKISKTRQFSKSPEHSRTTKHNKHFKRQDHLKVDYDKNKYKNKADVKKYIHSSEADSDTNSKSFKNKEYLHSSSSKIQATHKYYNKKHKSHKNYSS